MTTLSSILIATHNRPELLALALASVVAQTYSNWEIVLVDDGSSPAVDAASLDPSLAGRVRIFRHESPMGSGAARNTAIRHAKGQILAFLDDDDLLAPTFIEKAVDVLDRHPGLDMVCMGVSWFGKDADAVRDTYVQATNRFLEEVQVAREEGGALILGSGFLPAIVKRVPMVMQQQVLRREAAVILGPFTEGRILDRSDWAIRAALYLKVGVLEEGLYLQRCDGQSYASRSDRHAEFLWAGVDLIEKLIVRANSEKHDASTRDVLKQAASKSWFDLSYFFACRGEVVVPLKALCASQRHWFVAKRLRMLARLMLNLFRIRWQGDAGSNAPARHG